MLQLEVSPEEKRRLLDISARTGETPDTLVQWAIRAYLNDLESGPRLAALVDGITPDNLHAATDL